MNEIGLRPPLNTHILKSTVECETIVFSVINTHTELTVNSIMRPGVAPFQSYNLFQVLPSSFFAATECSMLEFKLTNFEGLKTHIYS